MIPLYAVSKSTTSNEIFSVRKLSGLPNVTGRESCPIGLAVEPGTMPWKAYFTGFTFDLGICMSSNAPANKIFKELPPSIKTRLTLQLLIVGSTTIGNLPGRVEGMGQSSLLKEITVSDHLDGLVVIGDSVRLPSLRPDGLKRMFFFPGFDAGTGGLLREADLLQRRRAFELGKVNEKLAKIEASLGQWRLRGGTQRRAA